MNHQRKRHPAEDSIPNQSIEQLCPSSQSHATRMLIGLRLLNQDMPTIPAAAIYRMPYSAQCAAVAVNITGDSATILAVMAALGIRNAEAALKRCVVAVPGYIPDMTMKTSGCFPPDPVTLFVAALEVLLS
jgi:hypothetical protein